MWDFHTYRREGHTSSLYIASVDRSGLVITPRPPPSNSRLYNFLIEEVIWKIPTKTVSAPSTTRNRLPVTGRRHRLGPGLPPLSRASFPFTSFHLPPVPVAWRDVSLDRGYGRPFPVKSSHLRPLPHRRVRHVRWIITPLTLFLAGSEEVETGKNNTRFPFSTLLSRKFFHPVPFLVGAAQRSCYHLPCRPNPRNRHVTPLYGTLRDTKRFVSF